MSSVAKIYNELILLMNIKYLILILSQVLFSQTKLEQAVIKELNFYRKKHGLVALTYDVKSSEMARYHAIYLKTMNELGYSSLDFSSEQQHDEGIDLPHFKEMTFEERARQVLPIRWVGEILIQCSLKLKNDQETAKAIINAFHNSPGHRKAMQFSINPKILDRVTPIVSLSVIETDSVCPIVVNIDIGYLEKK